MRAGRLRQRVEIQALTTSQDGYGEPVESWATTTTVWADVTPALRATREAFAAASGQRLARATYEVRMRYRAGLTAKDTRLVWGGKLFEVEAVLDPDRRRRQLLLLCFVQE